MKKRKIGLALSGGGFRASVFHIGVLTFLAEKKQLENIEKKGLTSDDLLSIDDIIKVATSNNEKRKAISTLLLQRIDSKAFTLDVKGYFKK